MPHKQTHPNVKRQRDIAKYVAQAHEMPHDAGFTELPKTNLLPTPLAQIPRIGPTTVSFRKIQNQIPRS